jgi:hypothetical protein
MRKFSGILLLMAACLLAGACSDDSGDPPLTIRFKTPEDGDGNLQYYTNDPGLYGYISYSWFTGEVSDVYTMGVNRKSGSDINGYGMLFCVSSANGGITDFYRVLITVTGAYQVCRVVNWQGKEESHYYIPENGNMAWPRSDNLLTGYNKKNTLEVRKTDANTFALYFNGEYETTFTDPDPLSGIQTAYFVSIGDEKEENFPSEPVDIRFYN